MMNGFLPLYWHGMKAMKVVWFFRCLVLRNNELSSNNIINILQWQRTNVIARSCNENCSCIGFSVQYKQLVLGLKERL